MAGTVPDLERRVACAATILEERGLSPRDTIPLEALLDTASSDPLPVVSLAEPTPMPSERGPHGAEADLIGIGTLGEGGMGRVLLARQRSLGRDVAVKTLKPGASKREREGLLREARIIGSLEHPGIVPVHALGVDADGRPLLVMKRVLGVDWEALLRDPAHQEWSKVDSSTGDRLDANLEILKRVCQALELAHSRGIIHRDVKTANVMVGAFGEVYLADWGIGTAIGTTEDALIGTPTYMAPEMITGHPLDARTDVFLLGAVLHRIVTGRERYEGDIIFQVVAAAAICEPYTYPPDVPAQLAALCRDACARDPAERPSSARAFRDRLVAFSRHRSAIVLSEAALERLAELEALLAPAGGEGAPKDLVRAHRLAAEARFGLMFCLRTYPEHAAASAGLARCFRALVDLELRQGHVDAAVAVLGEMTDVDDALVARVERARKAKALDAREQERLRALDRDQDASISKRERLLTFGSILVFIAAVSVFAQLGKTDYAPGDPMLAAYAGAILTFSLVVAIKLRRGLLATAFNRRLAHSLLGILAAIVLNRVVAIPRATPVDVIITTDLMLTALGALIMAMTQLPRLAVVLVPLFAGLGAVHARPEIAPQIYGVTALIAFGCSAWALRTGRAKVP